MDDSRRIISDDGKGFVFWGVLITIGLLATYFSVIYKWHYLNWFWPALIGFGWIYTIIAAARKEKRVKTRTLAGKIMTAVWIGCGVAMTIIGFAGTITGAYGVWLISPLISIVLGVGYMATGVISGKTWISLLSIGWWAGAVIMLFMYNLETLLVMAAMMILFQTIPGIMLYAESEKLINDE